MVLAPPLLQAAPAPFVGAGEVFALISAACWGIATVVFRDRLREHDPMQAALFKNVLATLAIGFAAVLVVSLHGRAEVPTGDLGWLALSGGVGIGIGDWFYFVALAHIGVTRTLVLIQFTPILSAVLAWMFLGETLSALEWSGAAVVLIGSAIAEARSEPRTRADRLGLLAVTATVLTWAFGNLITRAAVTSVDPIEGSAWRLVGACLALFAVLAFQGRLRVAGRGLLDRSQWRALAPPTLIGTVLGLACLTAALKWTQTGVASSLSSTTPLFSIPLAVLWLGERPGPRGWFGVAVVLAGVGLFLFDAATV